MSWQGETKCQGIFKGQKYFLKEMAFGLIWTCLHINIPEMGDSMEKWELGRLLDWQRNVQLLSLVQLFATPWTGAYQPSLSSTISRSLCKLMSIESVILSNHLILCCPLLLLLSIFPSIRVFSDQSALGIRWSKCWSFSFSINPSNEYSGLISFRIDWFDLLAVWGILKSLLQHHNSKASFFLCSAKN